MTDTIPSTAPPFGEPAPPTAASQSPPTLGATKWTAGKVAAFVLGVLLTLGAILFLAVGTTILWADATQRDTGYVTTGPHTFSSSGSAIATEVIELGDPGVGWLYAPLLLGEVRIRVTATEPDTATFVGIGPSNDVARYLGPVGHSVISRFWSDQVEYLEGGTPSSDPRQQAFWAASDVGRGARTLLWEPTVGSWTVVVMNADGHEGIAFSTDLGARMPALLGIGVVSLAAAVVQAVCGLMLIRWAIRKRSVQVTTS